MAQIGTEQMSGLAPGQGHLEILRTFLTSQGQLKGVANTNLLCSRVLGVSPQKQSPKQGLGTNGSGGGKDSQEAQGLGT